VVRHGYIKDVIEVKRRLSKSSKRELRLQQTDKCST